MMSHQWAHICVGVLQVCFSTSNIWKHWIKVLMFLCSHRRTERVITRYCGSLKGGLSKMTSFLHPNVPSQDLSFHNLKVMLDSWKHNGSLLMS
jgi:hypothetical protein